MNARRVFPFVAVGFGVAAAFHAVAVFVPIDRSSPWSRHALFVAVDVAIALGMLRRPRWFTWAFGVLVVQQLWSHGRAFVAGARASSFDVSSSIVLISMPVVLALLIATGQKSAVDERT